jgi:lon-related putative ATP-dependent protease
LFLRCDPDALGFDTTETVDPLDGMVGQERALSSLAFGLDIGAEGYNLFVSGPTGTGRNSTIHAVLQSIADARSRPADLCYVHDFANPGQPSAIHLEDSRGQALAEDMVAFISACRRDIPRSFEDESYVESREELAEELRQDRQRIFAPLDEEAGRRGFTISVSPVGVATIPQKPDGQPMSREEFTQLPEKTRQEIEARGDELKARVSDAVKQVQRLEKVAQERFENLDDSVALFTIKPLLEDLREQYQDSPKVVAYLDQVQLDILKHVVAFRAPETDKSPINFLQQQAEDFFNRYVVNVIVGQEDSAGAPVVVENNPTYYNLFGRIDYRSQLGAVTTDHTMIKAGAIHRANGGYLILQAFDVLTTPLVWLTLKRTIRSRELRIENLGEQYSAVPVATLNPEPVALDVKIVLVGTPWVYQLLQQNDEDFRKLFRARADFSVDMPRNTEGVTLYTSFVRTRVDDAGLKHFDKEAVARVVEYGSRLVEHQEKLSTRFIEIADLLTEADFWAAKDQSDVVGTADVERAIEEKIYRSNLIEERIHELIESGTIRIDTEADVVGQVNGIAVYDLGDYRFGRPSKITARVSLGRGQVVNIEREIDMSGRIHSKAFMILNGYLHGKYAQERLLSFSASIGFEQTYDEVEGDSASAAELYALLSALAEAPVKQGIAVTGSINQQGEVQAIGGVNTKVEGFYAVCKARGLTGDQGVLIPSDNVKHLMLRRDVVDAVEQGQFNVWTASNVDEGIEIVTGVAAGEADARGRYPPGSINRRVMDRLAKMARRLRPRRRGAGVRTASVQEDSTGGEHEE